jgi:hypothetical protein
MTNSLTFTLVHTRGVRFLSDLSKLNSTPDLRENLKEILDKNFNSEYVRCQPHIYYLVSTIVGIIFLSAAILLIKFIGNIGFYLLPVGILGIISPCFFTCWSDKKSATLFYDVMTKIDSETFGIHKMTGTFNSQHYINTFTISTNTERLKRIKGGNKAEPKPKPNNLPKPNGQAKLTPKNNQKKQEQKSSKIILHDTPAPQNPNPDKPYNPIQPQPLPNQNRLTSDTMPIMGPNRFSQGHPPLPGQPGPMPFYGPFPNPQQPGTQAPFQPFSGGYNGYGQVPNQPFNPNVNMNQHSPFPNDDLMIHEINVGGDKNKMTYGNDLYQVPSNVVDEHSEKKK